MIEYLATAGAVGFAFGVVLWRERRHPSLFVAALAAGLIGMLVKPTTAVFWILPALAYRPRERDPSGRRETDRPVARRAGRGAARRSGRLDAARGRHQGGEPGDRVAHELEPPALELRLAGAAHRSECVVLDPSAHRPEPVEPQRRPARARCDRRVALDPAALLARRRLGGGAASARLHEPLRQPRLLPRRDQSRRRRASGAGLRLGMGRRPAAVARRCAAVRGVAAGVGHARARTGLLAADPRRLRRSSGDAARERDRGTHPEHRSGGDGRSRLVTGRPLLRPPAWATWSRRTPAMPVSPRSTTTATGTCSSPSRFARTWGSWSGGGGSARSAPHLYGLADVGARLPAADLLATDPGPSLAGRLDRASLRRRCAGGAEVLGGDTHSRGTGGDVAALRGGCPRGSGVGRRPRARAREARRLRLARTHPERHARRLVRRARRAQPGRRAGRSCPSLSAPTYPGGP